MVESQISRLFVMGALKYLMLVPCLSLLGCGEAGVKLIPVSGVISLEGKPLPNVSVSFRPDESKGNKQGGYLPVGNADQAGKFTLTTTSGPGAPAGWYKVVVTPILTVTGGELPKPTPLPYNAKYADPDKTDLSVEVGSGKPAGAYNLELTK